MSRNNDNTTGSLMDFAYFVGNCRLTAIDLSNHTKLKDRQQISFIRKLENQAFGATMFFITEKSEETTFNFTKFCIKMEIQNILNLLNSSENEYSKCVTKKWYVIDSETKGLYWHHSPITFLTKSSLFNKIKSLWLFWSIYVSYSRYCCHNNYW